MKNTAEFELEQTRNVILGSLSPQEAARLRPHLSRREFVLGDRLAQPDQVPDSVLFPESGMLSCIVHSKQNVDVEIAVVGREGVHDALLVLSDMPRADHVIVQAPGWGWSLPTSILRTEFGLGGTIQRQVLRYLDLFHTQAVATGTCNRLHTIEERLARWLLTMRNAAESDEFDLPAEFVAAMLGSRLSGVPIALGVLQQAGLIMADRHVVRLLDVPALERTACECYALLADRLRLYLGDVGVTASSADGASERHVTIRAGQPL